MDKQTPVYKRLWTLEREANSYGYNVRTDELGIVIWSRREPKPGTLGTLHNFAFNDDGIDAAYNWLQVMKDQPAE